MDKREQMRVLLSEKLDIPIYIDPPSNKQMSYPCVICELSTYNNTFANNKSYVLSPSFTVTLISKNFRDDLVLKILGIQTATHDTFFTADQLYHNVFTIKL